MYVSMKRQMLGGRLLEPGDPIEEPEKIRNLDNLVRSFRIISAGHPRAPKGAPKWIEQASEERPSPEASREAVETPTGAPVELDERPEPIADEQAAYEARPRDSSEEGKQRRRRR